MRLHGLGACVHLLSFLLQAQEDQPTSFPSLLSHITSMHLNAEVLSMPLVQEKLPPPALRSFAPLSTTVPCDFHLLNLRTLQGEVSPGLAELSKEAEPSA